MKIRSKKKNNYPLSMFMKDSRMILQYTKGSIEHMWREKNICADSLTKFEGLQNDKRVLMDKSFDSVNLIF